MKLDIASITLFAAGALAAPSPAQTTLFADDFEGGLGAWQAEGQWHLSPSVCYAPPSPGGGGFARWGQPGECTFHGVLAGSLTLAAPVQVPATAEDARLSYWSYSDSELCLGWDFHRVEASTDGGATWQWIGSACSDPRVWVEREVDLSALRGHDVLVRFSFDAADHWGNFGVGWGVDNVRVEVAACAAETYCTAAPNSFSPSGAHIDYAGTRRVHVNDFTLIAEEAPPGQFGVFFYGHEAMSVAVGDGFLCVDPGALGLARIGGPGQVDANGALAQPLDLVATQATSHAVHAGSVWRFQLWFRDPSGGPAGTNYSDAMAVTFCP